MDGRWVAVAALILLSTRAARAAEPDTDATKRERATLLAAHLPDQARVESVPKAFVWLWMGAGAASTALALYLDARPSRAQIAYAATGGVAVLGASAVLLVPEPMERDMTQSAAMLYFGGLYCSMALRGPNASVERAYYSMAVGYGTSAVLNALNLGLSHPPSSRTLWSDYRSVRTPQARRAISNGQVQHIEQDFVRTERAIPPWVAYAPVAIGGVVGAFSTVDADFPARERAPAIALGATSALFGLGMMLVPSPLDEYRRDLRRAGLRIALGPPPGNAGGLSVVGIF